MDSLDKINNLIALVNTEMKNFSNDSVDGSLDEAIKKNPSYEVYHETYAGAIADVLAYAEAKGYTYDPEETSTKIGMGPRKPDEGKTNRFTITLFKDGVEQKKALHIQVYGNRTNYELNAYIS
jgi:hypothetical protein